MTRPTSAVLLVAGWALLLAAWTFGNPPFAAPDEADHYVRAVGVSSGHLLGRPATGEGPGATPLQRAWTRQATRVVRMPAGLAVPLDCYLHDPRRSAACSEAERVPRAPTTAVTAVGTYQPLPYLLPAATLRLAGDPRDAVRWARVPGALAALLLLALGVAAVRDPGDDVRALLGPLAAATPMVLFCAGSLTGSGLEIAAAVAFTCALLRLTRRSPSPRWVWSLAGGAGAALALSRSASPLWMLLLLALPLALVGVRRTVEHVRRAGRPAVLALTALLGAAILNRAWEAAYGPHVDLATRAIPLGLRTGLHQWMRASGELVGGFGYLELVLPLWLPLLWLAVVATLPALAWRAADAGARRVLIGTATVAVLLPLLLYVAVIRATGFGLQGRHVLPVVVALPLLAGELAYRGRVEIPRPALMAIGAAVGLVQLAAFWLDARRSAVGVDGPLLFVGRAQWAPPLGWAAILALAAAGACALVAVTARTPARAPRRPRRPSTTRSRSRRGAGPTRTGAPR